MIYVNLIPRPVQLARMRRARVRRWSISVAMAACALFVGLALDLARQARAQTLQEEGIQLQRKVRDLRAQLEQVSAESNNALLQIERAKALRSKRAWSSVFALIETCLPQGCWLTKVTTDPPQPAGGGHRVGHPTAPTAETKAVTIDAPRKLRIEGYAQDDGQPSKFVEQLTKTSAFGDVVLEGSQREVMLDDYHFRFEIVCSW